MQYKGKEIIWYKNSKLLFGVILVILSFALGFYSKILFIAKFYEPVYLITGLSIYAVSWVMLFFGAFLIGWESVKLIQQRVNYHVRRTMRTTYDYTRQIPRRSLNYTRGIGKRLAEKNKNKRKER